MQEDIDRWNRKYAAMVSVEPAGEPELVHRTPPLLGRGLALELACGQGANALYLAQLGYQVIAVDGAINGLVACHRAALRLGLPVYPAIMDLDRIELPCNHFDLIVVVRYLNRTLYPLLIDALAPGGILFYKTFNERYLSIRPTFRAEYVLAEGELEHAFGTLERLSSGKSDTMSYILSQRPQAAAIEIR